MPLDVFMALVLGHPEHGYYMCRDPFGAAGDFTTAPEISQMFGEMIAAWLADMWMQAGRPDPFILLEAGPGRGTLMADILRAVKAVPDFLQAAQIALIEISPYLRTRQKAALKGFEVCWYDGLDSVPVHAPLFFVMNEFFDALPLQQFSYQGGSWLERKIAWDGGRFTFYDEPVQIDPVAGLDLPPPRDGAVIEVAPERTLFMAALSARLRAQGGAGLIIDYGYTRPAYGDTFQAMRGHGFSDPLQDIGLSDLTSHVDFSALARAAQAEGIDVLGIAEQGAFLSALGIGLRARHLMQNASGEVAVDIQKALHRLTHSGEMGALFKVMGVGYGASIQAAGFQE